ncbi:MAG: hypothetical protein AAGF19_03540 [Pseudomonadota bacterium]
MKSLSTYDDWKHCITVECGIPLTAEYIESRLKALKDESDLQTKKFASEWGPAHLTRVIGWFEKAKLEN